MEIIKKVNNERRNHILKFGVGIKTINVTIYYTKNLKALIWSRYVIIRCKYTPMKTSLWNKYLNDSDIHNWNVVYMHLWFDRYKWTKHSDKHSNSLLNIKKSKTSKNWKSDMNYWYIMIHKKFLKSAKILPDSFKIWGPQHSFEAYRALFRFMKSKIRRNTVISQRHQK